MGQKDKIFLTCLGDVNDRDTWSGTPYHFLEAAKRLQLIDEGLSLHPTTRRFRIGRMIWNFLRFATLNGSGGYQYSNHFLDSLWRPMLPRLRGSTVINQFQLYPLSVVTDSSISKWFYIDGTLRQLFDYYGSTVQSKKAQNQFIAQEAAGYRSAQQIVAMSRFAADSVVQDYNIDPAKVHVVVPGANILPEEYAAWEANASPAHLKHQGSGKALKMVFIGKDWQRKGLDRLLRAMQIARSAGANATLRVIGCARDSLPAGLQQIDGVEWYGFISRQREPQRFLSAVTECNVGCLLSRAEFSSIALREFLSFGMVVIGPRTGGCPELVEPEASLLIDPSASDQFLADQIVRLASDDALLTRMSEAAWRLRRNALWDHSVTQFTELIQQSRQTR